MTQYLGDKLNGSALKIIALSSPVALNLGGSTSVYNASGFNFGTLVISGGSTAAQVRYKITRSATSDGTFGDIGASIQVVDGSANAYVRSFAIDASTPFLRGEYAVTGATSVTFAATLILGGARQFPITQDTRTTVYSDRLGQ